VFALRFLALFVPGICFGLACYPIWKTKISQEVHAVIMQRISERNKGPAISAADFEEGKGAGGEGSKGGSKKRASLADVVDPLTGHTISGDGTKRVFGMAWTEAKPVCA
jgi:hypothetical protein